MTKLNYELRRELEEKDRDLDHARSKIEEYEQLYQTERDNIASLKRQLERRDTMLTNSILAHDVSCSFYFFKFKLKKHGLMYIALTDIKRARPIYGKHFV